MSLERRAVVTDTRIRFRARRFRRDEGVRGRRRRPSERCGGQDDGLYATPIQVDPSPRHVPSDIPAGCRFEHVCVPKPRVEEQQGVTFDVGHRRGPPLRKPSAPPFAVELSREARKRLRRLNLGPNANENCERAYPMDHARRHRLRRVRSEEKHEERNQRHQRSPPAKVGEDDALPLKANREPFGSKAALPRAVPRARRQQRKADDEEVCLYALAVECVRLADLPRERIPNSIACS